MNYIIFIYRLKLKFLMIKKLKNMKIDESLHTELKKYAKEIIASSFASELVNEI